MGNEEQIIVKLNRLVCICCDEFRPVQAGRKKEQRLSK